ncbi:MAG TPA: 23S rRNA (adenine(2503)-C(2))-methyltransferase RlmN [Thermotogota bacterium]|nr:23S rRNA (adenine(2503)-C(2))-methyltransferase RlmN [Thermotogota bacterium]
MINILEFELNQLKEHFQQRDIKAFRAQQVFDWVYKKHVFSFEKMHNLSKDFRESLIKEYTIGLPTLNQLLISSVDETKKYLWDLHDGEQIESVLLIHKDRITACISTQVGCSLNCSFCATGKGGFVRNLKVSEITSQILAMSAEHGERIGNVVFMGMGEPFLNYDNVKKAIHIFHSKEAFDISKRRISISTAGIIPGILKMSEDFPEVVLSISLHAPNSEIRDQLMPVNKKYPFEQLINTIRQYNEHTGKRVTIEYLLIKGVNDSMENATQLLKALKELKINVNLIPVNPVNPDFERPSVKHVAAFKACLEQGGIETVVRHEKGTDIAGACGQLKNQKN